MRPSTRQLVIAVLVVIGASLLGAGCSEQSTRPDDAAGLPPIDGPGDGQPPHQLAAPTDLRVTDVGESFFQLTWSDTTGQPPGILVQGRLLSEPSFTLLAVLDEGADTWEATAIPESTYVFRVAAHDDDRSSAWTDPVEATALRAGYWDVTGGIENAPCGRSVFFRFGRTNGFSPPGTLTIVGPAGWNDGQAYERHQTTYYIGMPTRGAASGTYHLTFAKESRQFSADVAIDADLVLPVPEVTMEQLPQRQLRATWSCAGAESFAICWGPAGQAPCSSVGTCTDTVLTALEDDMVYWLSVSASAADLGGGQPARSVRHLDVNW